MRSISVTFSWPKKKFFPDFSLTVATVTLELSRWIAKGQGKLYLFCLSPIETLYCSSLNMPQTTDYNVHSWIIKTDPRVCGQFN